MNNNIENNYRAQWDTDWLNPSPNWKTARHITVGVDVGSVSVQAVIVTDEQVLAYSNLRRDAESRPSAENALDRALRKAGITADQIRFCVGTGYGRVNIPFSDKSVTEISCIARGAHYIYGPNVRTVLDVGGQDIKIIHCDEKGKVNNFHMNDKCGAGTGRGMETFADLMGLPIVQIGEQSFKDKDPEAPLDSKCVIYAKSEAINRMKTGSSKEDILSAYCRSMAVNITEVIKKIGIIPEFAVTGGMAKNRGVIERVVSLLNTDCLTTEWDPQIAGALGAALFALTLAKKGKKRKKKGK